MFLPVKNMEEGNLMMIRSSLVEEKIVVVKRKNLMVVKEKFGC
jgi:hypothetical protein